MRSPHQMAYIHTLLNIASSGIQMHCGRSRQRPQTRTRIQSRWCAELPMLLKRLEPSDEVSAPERLPFAERVLRECGAVSG